ncbi:MAG: CRISPR-associated protein Cas5 [Methylotenera sp.]|nr:CRISPR-associated protein Cas5 [Flavobacterium sp.]
MKFLRIRVSGSFNSFRQPDFQTYHKTLPLPPKTTVAGMLGAALGISPKEVNDKWLENNRFQMGIVGYSNGKASDLWQIDKITGYGKGDEKLPGFRKIGNNSYYKAVIIREILFNCNFVIYLNFTENTDFESIKSHLENPVWALSLGREDELIKMTAIDLIEIEEKEGVFLQNTMMPLNEKNEKYDIDLSRRSSDGNLLNEAPKTVKLPMTFLQKEGSEAREAKTFQDFIFVSQLPIKPIGSKAFFDEDLQLAFQIF